MISTASGISSRSFRNTPITVNLTSFKELPAQQNAMLYAHVQRSRGRFEKNREAWELFWSAAKAKKRRYRPEIGVPPAVEKVASQARLRRAWMELGEWLVSRQ